MVERLVCCYQYLSSRKQDCMLFSVSLFIQAGLYVVISISLHTSRHLWIRTENCQMLVKLPLSWTVFIWIICQLSSLESHFLAAPILSGTPFYYCGCCSMVRCYQSCNSSLVLPFHTSALVYNMLILQLNIQRRILIPNSWSLFWCCLQVTDIHWVLYVQYY